MTIRNVAFSAIVATLLLSACSVPEGDFPSLAKRPYETDNPLEEPAETVTPAAAMLSPALAAKARALQSRHATGQSAFSAGLPAVRKIASGAAGSKVGSEAWVNAQLQLSRLDKARADSVAALAAMDDLVSDTEDADAAGGPIYAPLLQAIRSDMARDTSTQTETIDQLSRQIGE